MSRSSTSETLPLPCIQRFQISHQPPKKLFCEHSQKSRSFASQVCWSSPTLSRQYIAIIAEASTGSGTYHQKRGNEPCEENSPIFHLQNGLPTSLIIPRLILAYQSGREVAKRS